MVRPLEDPDTGIASLDQLINKSVLFISAEICQRARRCTIRYLIVLYYQLAKMSKKFDHKKEEEEIARMQDKYSVSTSKES